MAKRFWFKFEWALWRNDKQLRRCSKETRGFWVDCIAVMEENDTYFVEGTVDELCRELSCTRGEFDRSTAELVRTNAASIDENDGFFKIVSRKILKAANLTEYNRLKKAESRARQGVKSPSTPPSKELDILDIKSLKEEEKESPIGDSKEDAPPKPKKEKLSPTRIPFNFPLTPEMWQWVITEIPDLRNPKDAHENFIEHWSNRTDARASKVNWLLTWKKGMRLAKQWQDERDEAIKNGTNGNHNRQPNGGSGTTGKLSAEDIGRIRAGAKPKV